jgi:predicted phosphodiesterase
MPATKTVPFKFRQTSPGAIRVEVPIDSVVNWEQWFLLRSDVHWDNPKCHRDLEYKHLEQALDRRAGIIDAGDLFCAMQGKYDKRSDKRSIRPEHCEGEYIASLYRTAADYYRPFAHNFILMGQGNHETAVYKNHEFNLTAHLAERLNTLTGSEIIAGGYTGWIAFAFDYQGRRITKKLWYTHGYAGGGPVTKDTIQLHRQMTYVENADFVLSGHTHDAWQMEYTRLRLTDLGEIERRPCIGIKCPTYKDEYGIGEGGFAVEKGHPPKPLGAWWLKFTASSGDNKTMIHCDVIRAT